MDKRNELLAMEIRKKKSETSQRRKQILQLKAESEDIASTYHETFEFTEDDDDVMSGSVHFCTRLATYKHDTQSDSDTSPVPK